jgi:SAM-dependent methyltransferase
MSTDRTGAAQLARLGSLGLSVELLPPLRDIDEPADAEHVAERHPELQFSRRYREIESLRAEQPIERLFDRLYRGRAVAARQPSGGVRAASFTQASARWTGQADLVDQMVVSRCEPPVIDIGCGPGRMLSALQESGRAALGIDLSRVAVQLGHGQGGQLLRRGLHDELPAEGRWGTALLLDGNLGIGGDVSALLTRCRHLVGPGGLILCEVDPDPDCDETFELVLAEGAHFCPPTPWTSLGLHPILRLAPRLDLIVVEEWCAGGRAFVSMRTAA